MQSEKEPQQDVAEIVGEGMGFPPGSLLEEGAEMETTDVSFLFAIIYMLSGMCGCCYQQLISVSYLGCVLPDGTSACRKK